MTVTLTVHTQGTTWTSSLEFNGHVKQETGQCASEKEAAVTGLLWALRQLKRPVNIFIRSSNYYIIDGVNIYMHSWNLKKWNITLQHKEVWQEVYQRVKQQLGYNCEKTIR